MNDHLCQGIIGRGYVRPATRIFAKGDCRFVKIKVLCRLDRRASCPLALIDQHAAPSEIGSAQITGATLAGRESIFTHAARVAEFKCCGKFRRTRSLSRLKANAPFPAHRPSSHLQPITAPFVGVFLVMLSLSKRDHGL